jgi:hypothetical protein
LGDRQDEVGSLSAAAGGSCGSSACDDSAGGASTSASAPPAVIAAAGAAQRSCRCSGCRQGGRNAVRWCRLACDAARRPRHHPPRRRCSISLRV